jgi:hypothetical protein
LIAGILGVNVRPSKVDALLVMNGTLLGRRLNELQAAQLLFNRVDTTPAQAIASTLLDGTIRARRDVDRVMRDHSTAIVGTPINGAQSNSTTIRKR